MSRSVLFTASVFSHIANFHRPYLRAFQELGWQVDVACGGEVCPIPEARRLIPLPLKKSMTAPENLAAQNQLRRLIREEKYSLISTHTSLAAFFTRLAAAGLAVPLVYTCHGYLFDDSTPPLRRLPLLGAERLTAGRTDLLLTMNRYDYALARQYRLGKSVRLIPGMGVEYPPCDPAAGAALRQELGVTHGEFLLLYPAEFSPRKDQSTLIRAMALLPSPVRLCLPGNGELWEECKALAQTLGVADRVIFPGYVSDMAPWFAAAQCAVSSSRSEGLPFNVMEAMAAGLPLVATAVKGHLDLVEPEVTGLLYPCGDPQSCAQEVERLLADRELGERLGQAGKQAAQSYRLSVVLPQVMGEYRRAFPDLFS